jgi:hypothetical protein
MRSTSPPKSALSWCIDNVNARGSFAFAFDAGAWRGVVIPRSFFPLRWNPWRVPPLVVAEGTGSGIAGQHQRGFP